MKQGKERTDSDEQKVKRAIDGDTSAYEQLVRTYQKPLERYVARILGKRSDEVLDVVQSAFIRAYRNLRSFDPAFTFSTWIYRIAHNEAVNLIESGVLFRFKQIDLFPELYFSQSYEEELDLKLEKERLKGCIDKLELKYRAPLILYIYEEKRYDEISDILRIPAKTVGVRIHRAKLLVKQICNETKNK